MSDLRVTVAGIDFVNPVMLAAGTAAFGRSVDGVVELNAIGGLVTKAVSLEPRKGNPAPRVVEFDGGMLNSVGLANPGADAARDVELPWLAANAAAARVIVNVVGTTTAEFAEVIEKLDGLTHHVAYELNVSCPNVKAGGTEFGADHTALTEVVSRARAVTRRPLFVKLSPVLANVGETARVAEAAGANAITVVNTIPGLAIDVETRRPRLGFGNGGTSGAAILPVGVLATYRVRAAVQIPVFGIGGISTAEDALQYIMAGASLVGIGTAALRDPRAPARIASGLGAWLDRHNVARVQDLIGSVSWPA